MHDVPDRHDPSRRLRVFLCHASGDKPAVRELHRRLIMDRYQPWLDEEDLLPGQDWREEIPKAVRGCDVVVVCLSGASVTKAGYLQREIKEAVDVADEQPEGTIFIVPAKLEECEVPRRLSQWHWAALFQENGYERLVRALKARSRALHLNDLPPASMPAPRDKPRPAPSKGEQNFDLDGSWWVALPGGRFQMGSVHGHGEEKPVHPVNLSGFRISRYPVTNTQYAEYVGRGKGVIPPGHWVGGKIPEGKEGHPVIGVSWDDAGEFCEWLARRLNALVDLPTEAQWEYAARGKDGREYPWGKGDNPPTPSHANYGDPSRGTTPVGTYAKGATPEGIHDLAGNVWEWCRDWHGKYPDEEQTDPPGPTSGGRRVLRGGSFGYAPYFLRGASRGFIPPEGRFDGVGFRCVASAPGGQVR